MNNKIANEIRTAIAIALLAVASTATAQDSRQRRYDLGAQDAVTGLQSLALQGDFQVFFPTDLVKGRKIQEVRGDYKPADALQIALKGTGLRFRVTSAGTYVVEAESSVRSSTSPSAPDRATNTLLLAQARGEEGAPRSSEVETGPALYALEEILVTGTYIRGAAPIGSPLKIYSRQELDRSGAATLDQFARQMTENFSNADVIANVDSNAPLARFGTASNPFAGSAFNLRGVGAASTLTLVNGHRLAQAGLDGGLTDMSLIPMSAIERIEVLTDGASAIYGADAIAGVVNIIMRSGFDGAETRARYGSATADGAGGINASQLFGKSWSAGSGLLSYEYDEQDGLDASDRDYIADQGGAYSLIPKTRRNSVFVSGTQELGGKTRLSADVLYSDRDFSSRNTSVNDFFSQSGSVSGEAQQSGVTLTLERALGRNWTANLTANYSDLEQVSSSEVTATFGNSSLSQEANADVTEVNLAATGSLIALRGGDIRAAVGASYLSQSFDSRTVTTFGVFESGTVVPKLDRDVASVYGELSIPLVGSSNAVPAIQQLALSLAVRYDDYSDFGSTTNPKVGLAWEPVPGLMFRGSYGTSFRAALLSQIGTPVTSLTTVIADPLSASGFANTLVIQGGSGTLEPEESESFTAGIDWRPAGSPELSVGLSYFRLDFQDRVARPPVAGLNPLTDPGAAPFTTRNPSLSEVQAYFASPGFLFDGGGQGPSGVTTIYDSRYSNISATRQSGIDLTSRYNFDAAVGRFSFAVDVSHLLKNEYETVSTLPAIELLDAFGQPTKWRGRGSVDFVKGPYSLGIALSYVDSYANTLFTPARSIEASTTGNIYVGYRVGEAVSNVLLRGTALVLAVNNVTDEKPPRIDVPAQLLLPGARFLPFDPANASPIGRFIALTLVKNW